MAITVKYLEDLGVEKSVAEKIFAERSKEIEAEKAKREKVEADLEANKKSLESLTKEFETLKTSNASAEEYKSKYEAIVADNEAKARQAEADRIAKEKAEGIDKRFDAVVGEKKFTHSAIRAEYRRQFETALSDKANEGKSDADVFHALTKDDATAFTGVTAVKLQGGRPQGVGGKQYATKEEVMAIKDSAERISAIQNNPTLFRKG
jgi:hypothetical protein